MRGEHSQQNNAVADIYEEILSGEEHALTKLQGLNLKNHFPRFIESYYNRKAKRAFEDVITQNIVPSEKQEKQFKEIQPQFKEVASEINIKNKQQTLLGILQKGRTNSTGLRKTHQRAASSLGQSLNEQSVAQETKKIFKKQSNVESTLNKKNSQPQSSTARQIQSSLPNILPKLQKGRESAQLGKSQNQIESANKTVLLDGKQRKGKQKIDFKDIIQANKRQKAQLQQKNEEQKKLQLQILHNHHSTKGFLEKMIAKYALNSNNQQKYLKRAIKKHDESIEKTKLSPDRQTTQKSSVFQKAMQTQQAKMSQLNDEIAELKHNFISNSRKLSRAITLCNTSPFSQYISKRTDTIDEESQEQDDIVQPLDSDLKERYSYLMAHTREKKWGLMQRTDYDRTHTLSESRRTTGLTEEDSTQQDSNRVVINQRLKNLLFS